MPISISPVYKSSNLSVSQATWDSFMSPNEGKARTTDKLYAEVAWIYRATQVRMQAVSRCPWRVVNSQGTRQKLDPHFAQRLPSLMGQTEGSLCLFGAAYWLPVRGITGDVGWYRWINPSTVTEIRDDRTHALTGFKRQLSGVTETYNAAPGEPNPDGSGPMVYFWLPSMFRESGPGTSPAQVASRSGLQLWSIDEYVNKFFANGALGTWLLFVDPNTRDGEMKRLEKWWKSLVGGLRRAFESSVFRSESFQLEKVGSDMADLAAPELTDLARQDVSTAFGVPDSMMRSSAANYATALSDRKQFYQDTILPELELIAGIVNEQVFADLDLEFEFLPNEMEVFQEEEKERADAFSAYVNAGADPGVMAQVLGVDLPEDMTYDEFRQRCIDWKVQTGSGTAYTLEPKSAPEIETWRRYARKYGADKAARDFVTHSLSPSLAAEIRMRLLTGQSPTGQGVDAAFRGPFLSQGGGPVH